ncbi:MAG: aspartate--tRNA ligase dps1 [Peltula sp. TS41687]|nr:MAG: aspartate--tRNA ligase dps1 [Peltula sp. TS41687]
MALEDGVEAMELQSNVQKQQEDAPPSTARPPPTNESSSSTQEPASATAGKAELSVNAAKKLAKAKKKEEEKAAKKREQEERQKQQEANVVDFAKDNYGKLPEPRPRPDVTTITDLQDLSAAEKDVTVQVRVQNTRAQAAKLVFLILRQGFSTIQAVVAAAGSEAEGGVSRQMVKWVAALSSETVAEVSGTVKEPNEPIASASISGLEIHVKKIYVVAEAVAQFPMQLESALLPELKEGEEEEEEEEGKGAKKDSKTSKIPRVSLKTRLDNRVVDLRTPTNAAITRIKHGVSQLFQEYLIGKGFVQIFTPKLMASASEGGSNVFAVKYFERMAYLAQSPQLHKQMAIGGDCGRVFEIGPVFRAENSNTHRHMTEFVGLDLEMTFKVHYHEVLDVLEGLFVHIFNGLKERYAREIEIVRKQYPVEEFQVPQNGQQMVRLTFSEGVSMLREAGETLDDYEDLSTPHERQLGKLVKEKYGTDFFILDQFPLAIRPFYTMPSSGDAKLSNSYDFFMRGEEIMSGAQRIHRHALLVERMQALGVQSDHEGLKDYVDSFKYGTPPHAGGGIGLERVVFLYLGLGNIRKASMFPRDPQRLRP